MNTFDGKVFLPLSRQTSLTKIMMEKRINHRLDNVLKEVKILNPFFTIKKEVKKKKKLNTVEQQKQRKHRAKKIIIKSSSDAMILNYIMKSKSYQRTLSEEKEGLTSLNSIKANLLSSNNSSISYAKSRNRNEKSQIQFPSLLSNKNSFRTPKRSPPKETKFGQFKTISQKLFHSSNRTFSNDSTTVSRSAVGVTKNQRRNFFCLKRKF